MHIGLVTATYKPVINGVTRMVALYKSHLEAAGHQVTVFTLGEAGSEGDDQTVVRSPGLPLSNSGYYLAFRYSQEARELIADVDIIHCHHMIMGLEFAHKYGRSPIVYTNHTRNDLYARSYMHLPDPLARGLFSFLWPWLTGYCDVIVAPSESVKQILLDFGVTQPIEVINNGIETERFRNPVNSLNKQGLGMPQTGTLLVYVGRLAMEKNLEKLLYEFSLACKEMASLHLLLIGSGPEEGKLRQLTTRLKIAHRTLFVGAIPYQEIPRYLAAADIFITASESEVMPLTIIEAMAAGLPVVAIESPGINDLVSQGHTGILTGNSTGDLARGILLLSDDPNEQLRLGQKGWLVSQNYHISRTVRQSVLLYERLLAMANREHKNGKQNMAMRLPADQDSMSHSG